MSEYHGDHLTKFKWLFMAWVSDLGRRQVKQEHCPMMMMMMMEARPSPYANQRNVKALRSEVVQRSMMLRQVLFHLGLLRDLTQWLFGL